MDSLGIIGLGTIGKAIAQGAHRALPQMPIFGTRRGEETLPPSVTRCVSNAALASQYRTLVLAVKPQQIDGVLREIAPFVNGGHTVISTCAGVLLQHLRELLPHAGTIVRAMPNIACELNAGVTGLAFEAAAPEQIREQVRRFFALLGEVVTVQEQHFDAVTAIGGCGPAYACVIIEAITDAGVKQGLPRSASRLFAAQMLLGSAQLVLQSHAHPAEIRDRVTTPGGCTIDALTALEDGKIRAALIAAVATAAEKSSRLARHASVPDTCAPGRR